MTEKVLAVETTTDKIKDLEGKIEVCIHGSQVCII